jgi:hypothetical protein
LWEVGRGQHISGESTLQSGWLEVVVDAQLIGSPELVSRVSSSGERLLKAVERQSVVVGVHHIEQSSSVERSNGSVIFQDSPCVEGSMSADVVVIRKNDLLGNVDSSKSDEGSVRLFPLNIEVVDGVSTSVLLELSLEIEAVILSGQSVGHVLSQIVPGSVCWKRESNGCNVFAGEDSVLDGWIGKRSLSKLVRRDGIVGHAQLRRYSVVREFHSRNSSVWSESLSEGRSASISSTTELSSGLYESTKSGLVLRNKDGESVEHNVHAGVILKSRKKLSAWHVEDLDGESFSVSSGIVLLFLVLSRESKEHVPHLSWLENTHPHVLRKGWLDGKGAVHASSGWKVKGSSVSSWEVSLRLELSKARIEVVVHKVDVSSGERGLLSKFESSAVGSDVSRTRETRDTIRNSLAQTETNTKKEEF